MRIHFVKVRIPAHKGSRQPGAGGECQGTHPKADSHLGSGQNVRQWRRRVGRGATVQIHSGVAQERFCNGPMHANTDEGPPAVGPGVTRAITQLAGSLASLEGGHFTDNGDGVLRPPTVDLAPQHQKRGFLA